LRDARTGSRSAEGRLGVIQSKKEGVVANGIAEVDGNLRDDSTGLRRDGNAFLCVQGADERQAIRDGCQPHTRGLHIER